MYKLIQQVFKLMAKTYVALHRPTVIAVGGSVGKTSTKLMLAQILSEHKKVSYMDDSYNYGLGLYLSVFQLKVPRSKIGWVGKFFQAIWRTITVHPEILILEYGIDSPGEMDEMVQFIRPDISILTAVTPEHMESLKTIDMVGREEGKILQAAKNIAVYNQDDVDDKYVVNISAKQMKYGRKAPDARYVINSWGDHGPDVTFHIQGKTLHAPKLRILSEALIRQLSGALLVASILGIEVNVLARSLSAVRSAAGRMSLLDGVNGAVVIDDTANFSPVAGVSALRTLKQMRSKRHLALLGNMHELGDFADEGYAQVSSEIQGVDVLVLVGDLSVARFGKYARENGFVLKKNLYFAKDAIEAGILLKETLLREGDLILVKGPFGEWYLEEAVRIILRDPSDSKYLTRQSGFWSKKKKAHFGAKYDATIEI